MNTEYWIGLLAFCAILFAIGLLAPRKHKKHKCT
jgi:hypothetical protein